MEAYGEVLMSISKCKSVMIASLFLVLLTGCSTKATESPSPPKSPNNEPQQNNQSNQDRGYITYAKQSFSYSNPELDNDFKNIDPTVTLHAPKIPFKPDKIEPYADDLKSGMKRLFLFEYNTNTGQYIYLTVTKNATDPFTFPTNKQDLSIVPLKVGKDPIAFYLETKGHSNEVYWTNGDLLLSLMTGINTDTAHWGLGFLGDRSKPFLSKEDLVYAAESVLNN